MRGGATGPSITPLRMKRTRRPRQGQEQSASFDECPHSDKRRILRGTTMPAVARLDSADITGLLKAWGRGDQQALEQLMPLVYAQLRPQARRYMRAERSGMTLQSTALVHEAYLRLV